MSRLAAAVSLAGVIAFPDVGVRLDSAAAPADVQQATRATEAMLNDALRSPLPVSDLALKVAAYTLQDADRAKVRLLVACEIDRSRNPSSSVALAYSIADAKGAVVAKRFEPDVGTPVRSNRTQLFVETVTAEPAAYTITVAAIDDGGRRGRLERIVQAQLTPAGSIRVSDLLIGDKAAGEGGVTPSASASIVGDTLQAYVELYADTPDALKAVTAEIEVSGTAEGPPLERSWIRLQDASGAAPIRRAGEGSVLLAFLSPGSYVARAAITADGKRIGQVTRPFRIVRGGTNAPTGGPAARPAESAPRPDSPEPAVAARPDVFDKASVLTPSVLSYIVDKLNGATRGRATPAVLDAARAGQFDAALAAASDANPLVSQFLGGLVLFGKGDLDPAAAKFREAMRVDSEFFPAAFYLGACYASGGKDREATAVWSTSLVALGDAPFIYTQLADAYLRLRESDPALDILGEAARLWPGDEAVQLRQARALAASGKPSEALDALDPYLAKHPEDHAAILVALRTIFEARSKGKGIGTAAEDRQRFDRYASAYVLAKGPEQALVQQWRAVLDR